MPINIFRVGVRRMGPDSFQWCPATGQGAMGTNWGTGSSVWTWGRTSSHWGWQSTGTGCPGRLWSLLLWRYSRPSWTRSCEPCCRWPCFGRRVGLDDPQRSLPTPAILWFCDSVTFYNCNLQFRSWHLSCRFSTDKFLCKISSDWLSTAVTVWNLILCGRLCLVVWYYFLMIPYTASDHIGSGWIKCGCFILSSKYFNVHHCWTQLTRLIPKLQLLFRWAGNPNRQTRSSGVSSPW